MNAEMELRTFNRMAENSRNAYGRPNGQALGKMDGFGSGSKGNFI